jgi:hypothetical protein
MIAVKRNSREFKDIKDIFDDYEGHASRKKLILLYSVKPYESIEDRILLNDQKKDASVLYGLNYESVKDYLRDRSKKLFRENDKALYYFKSSEGSKWIEFPFELKGKLKEQVLPLKIVK